MFPKRDGSPKSVNRTSSLLDPFFPRIHLEPHSSFSLGGGFAAFPYVTRRATPCRLFVLFRTCFSFFRCSFWARVLVLSLFVLSPNRQPHIVPHHLIFESVGGARRVLCLSWRTALNMLYQVSSFFFFFFLFNQHFYFPA